MFHVVFVIGLKISEQTCLPLLLTWRYCTQALICHRFTRPWLITWGKLAVMPLEQLICKTQMIGRIRMMSRMIWNVCILCIAPCRTIQIIEGLVEVWIKGSQRRNIPVCIIEEQRCEDVWKWWHARLTTWIIDGVAQSFHCDNNISSALLSSFFCSLKAFSTALWLK